jgi:glycosyltransferase involved in cell wall biosynthesis
MLSGCLDSLAGLVDEVVLVDTGSADATPQIAAARGARVLHLPWGDDFAAARNHALDQAHGRWVLSVDADERAVGPGGSACPAQALRNLLAGEPAWDVFSLRVDSGPEPSERPWGEGWRPCLFRADPRRRWVGVIHECLAGPPDDRRARIAELSLRHLGARSDPPTAQRKHARNIGILRRALGKAPGASELHWYLGLELDAAGAHEEARRELDAAWAPVANDPAAWSPQWSHLAAALVLASLRVGMAEHGLRVSREVLGRHPQSPEFWWLLAACLRARAMPGAAQVAARAGLGVAEPDPAISYRRADIRDLLRRQLADTPVPAI